MILGHIDNLSGAHVSGWLGSITDDVRPFLTANGKACRLLDYGQTRQDVADLTGLKANVGYVAEVPDSLVGDIDLKLYALSATGKKSFVNQKKINCPEEQLNSGGAHQSTSSLQPVARPKDKHLIHNILLLWKQHDSGLYGRRVDQIARSLKSLGWHCNITLLEIMTDQQLQNYQAECSSPDSDKQFICADFKEKKLGKVSYGVNYKTIYVEHPNTTGEVFSQFLSTNQITPDNSLFILFPALSEYHAIYNILSKYRYICDIVDNQLTWSRNDPFPLLQQYASLCCDAVGVIFNSEINHHFFIENELCDAHKSNLIPNWYKTPDKKHKKNRHHKKDTFDILYSGNMNDRIDWDLIQKILNQCGDEVIIHLVGSADTVRSKIRSLIDNNRRIVYHGPMREEQLLEFSKKCDLAIMPHLHDDHSNYMNPLKLHMYSAIKLPCISTHVPGVSNTSPYITLCNNHDAFLKEVVKTINKRWSFSFAIEINKYINEKKYLNFIKDIVAP